MVSPTKVAAAALVAAVVVLAVYYISALAQEPGNVTTQVPSSFSINGKTFEFTYVATTQAERAAGLMNVKITNRTTMLFAFPYPGRWSFWMYDTNTSLDMIWLNATGSSARVVYVAPGVPPCYDNPSSNCPTYTPDSGANYVIEAKSGFAAANGISVGTTVQFA